MTDDILREDLAGQGDWPTYALGTALYAERDGQILLLKRAAGSAFAGQWYVPGGAVDPGETPDEAVVRELREEAGLEVTAEPELVGAYFARLYGRDVLMLSYRAPVEGDVVLSPEHDGARWVDPLDMKAFMSDDNLAQIARGDERIVAGLKLIRDDLHRYLRRVGAAS